MTTPPKEKPTNRNLNPHKAAVSAMYLYGREYAAQGGGSMDFWESLPSYLKGTCRALVVAIENAPEEKW